MASVLDVHAPFLKGERVEEDVQPLSRRQHTFRSPLFMSAFSSAQAQLTLTLL
jgi:hypothetical protein